MVMDSLIIGLLRYFLSQIKIQNSALSSREIGVNVLKIS